MATKGGRPSCQPPVKRPEQPSCHLDACRQTSPLDNCDENHRLDIAVWEGCERFALQAKGTLCAIVSLGVVEFYFNVAHFLLQDRRAVRP